MRSGKFLKIEDEGYVWLVPLDVIVHHRATYYDDRDPDTTYQDEYKYAYNDSSKDIDWYTSNMDWEDVERHAVLIIRPEIKIAPDSDPEYSIISR